VADLQDAVAHRDAGQRDEADQRRHRQRLARQPQAEHRADQRQRDVGHDQRRQRRRLVAAVQHHEHQHQRDDGQQADQARGLFLRLELAAQGDEVALGQLGLGHHLADVGHDLRQRPPLRVGRQHDAALAVVAADLVGAVAVLDGGEASTAGCGRSASRSGSGPGLRWSAPTRAAHHQRKAPAALDDLGDLLALDQRLQRGQHLRRRHAVLRRGGVVDAHLDLRRQHLLLDLQVGDAGDGGQPRAQGIGLAAQVSRSSPKILMAICERTPDSMWSMRCEMGWPISDARPAG
jgi:hypothetical protein